MLSILQNQTFENAFPFPASQFGDWTGRLAMFIARGAIASNVIGPVELVVSGAGTEGQSATLSLTESHTAVPFGRYVFAIALDPRTDRQQTVKSCCLRVMEG